MDEIWKDVAGFEGLYQVSNFGRIKSLARSRKTKGGVLTAVPECIRKPRTDKDGYKEIALSKGGKLYYFRVHRLVAFAFIPNPHNYSLINHRDENPANNHFSNLEWCNQSYNTSYSNYKVSHPVLCNGVIYPSIRACSRALKVAHKTIRIHSRTGELIRHTYAVSFL